MANRPKQTGGRAASGRGAIVVIGGGGHARVVISVLRKLRRYRILGYTALEDGGEILGTVYLGTDASLRKSGDGRRNLNAALAVGQVGLGQLRHDIWARLESRSWSFPAIVSPDAVLNEGVAAAEATVVMDGAVINSGATLGRGVIVNTNATVEHDVTVADWVHVAPGATISGGVTIGRFSMVGAGATVIEGIRIAEECMIGAGATVVEDILEPGVYAGCPARRIK